MTEFVFFWVNYSFKISGKRDGGNTHLCSIATMKNKEKTANSNICVLYPTTHMHQDHVSLFNCQLLTLHGLHVKA